ncbi:MAG: hypothetical protein Q9217_000686 [Psora testacea]
MGAPRGGKRLIKSRRRVQDEGEEEDDNLVVAAEDDSLSEGSIVSDADDDADGEGSDDSETEPPQEKDLAAESQANGRRGDTHHPSEQPPMKPPAPTLSGATGDTEAMMNGLRISEEAEAEEVHFDDLKNEAGAQISAEHPISQSYSTINDKRRREHDEYKKRRDEDPAFVPNRGGFFMHDHRSAAPGLNGFKPPTRGRGRGRIGIGGPFPPSSSTEHSGPVDAPWRHDLHETVAIPGIEPADSDLQGKQQASNPSFKTQPPNRSFSKTTRIGNVQVRVFLSGMLEPIVFSGVPVNSHTRLPHHRPPLRRDKPVRISIPEMSIRYIFPSTDRSFIFIPRALRPNQQGFGRVRGRGSFGAGYGSFGPLSSRRTSVYAGSGYSPSIAMSRRSSLAREAREVSAVAVMSPSQVMMNQQRVVSMEPGKPVVRLPPAAEQAQQQTPSGAPVVVLPQPSTYPLPQKPTFHENRPEDLPMYHPKPERSLQVADIESPAALDFNPPAPQQQPFHQQVPMQMTTQSYPPPPPPPLQYPHSRHPSHPSQASGGTPLPQIPEATIHAQPFQSFAYPPPQGLYPQQYAQPIYFYPPPDQGVGSPAAAPPFVPGQQYFYPMTMPPAPAPPPQAEPTTQAGTVAHEAGGMVYYYNPSELAASTESSATYPPAYAPAQATGNMASHHIASSPDTPVAVKITINGKEEHRRFKLILKDLEATVLPDKLRYLLAIPQSKEVVFERYSDSSASFVTLDSNNAPVYKQLYRAAKAKGKLRLRVTINDKSSPKLEAQETPMAATDRLPSCSYVHPYISDPSNADQSPSSRISTLEDLKTLSAAPSTATLTPSDKSDAKPKSERPPYFWPVSESSPFSSATKATFEKKSSNAEQIKEQNIEDDNGGEAPVPRFFSTPEECLNQLAAIQHKRAVIRNLQKTCIPTNFSICCNRCDRTIPDDHWHCGICDGGDYDLCGECVRKGFLCENDDHWLIKRFVKDGKVINSTTETIAPKQSLKIDEKKEIPGAFASDVKCEPINKLERTCNSCVQGDRYKCAVCHDTDFCAKCEALPRLKHNRTHPLLKFKTPVRNVSVSTYGEKGSGEPMRAMGDQPPPTSSKSTETTPPGPSANAATQVQTIVEVKPAKAVKEEPMIIQQKPRVSITATPLHAAFVRDTIVDGSVIAPNTQFTQTWTLRNQGPRTWPAGCSVCFVGGDSMLNIDSNHPSSMGQLNKALSTNTIDRPIEKGEEVDFAVTMRTSEREGKAISYWRLKTAVGTPFGHRLWCDVNVRKTAKVEEFVEETKAGKSRLKAEDAKVELETKQQAEQPKTSQMIFPTLEKESPVSSTHEAEPSSNAPVTAAVLSPAEQDLLEDVESLELDDDDESSDEGFLTDEEYELIASSDELEVAKNGKK